MFLTDYSGTPVLTLPSELTISGEVNIHGAIGGNQQAIIVLGEHSIAWKGRYPIPWGGEMYEGEDPYTGVFSKGGSPNVELYVFDGQWGTGARERTITADGLLFNFTSYLNQGTLPRVDVTATATAVGSIVPTARFHHWEMRAYPNVLTCGQRSRILFRAFDGTNKLYEPFGISPYDTYITFAVDAKGDYAYLQGGGEEGKEITMSLSPENALWLDTSRGEMEEEEEVATIRVTGGGKSAEIQVRLICEKLHHFSVTAAPEVLPRGGTATLEVIAEDINDNEVTPSDDFNVTFTLSSPDIIWGSAGDTSKSGGHLPSAPVILSKKLSDGADAGKVGLAKAQSSMYGSFSVDGGAPEPDQTTVAYSIARQGRVKYVADGEMLGLLESMTVNIRVEKATNPGKSGSADVTVRRSTPPVIDIVRTSTGDDFFGVGSNITLEGFYHDAENDVIAAFWSGPGITQQGGLIAPTQMVVLGNLGWNTFTFKVEDEAGNSTTKELKVEAILACSAEPAVINAEPARWDNNPECDVAEPGMPLPAGRSVSKDLTAVVEACMDVEMDRWRPRIEQVSMTIYYGICQRNTGLTWITSAADANTTGQACAMLDDFQSQVRQIDSLRSLSLEHDVPLTDAIIHKQYLATYAVLFHEEYHALAYKRHLEESVREAEAKFKSITLGKKEARNALEATGKMKPEELISTIRRGYLNIRAKQFDWDEVKARAINSDVLRVLVADLKAKCK